jgi:hypothetical protein
MPRETTRLLLLHRKQVHRRRPGAEEAWRHGVCYWWRMTVPHKSVRYCATA